jgi:CDP-4-dehydro-6-deoxyglucose reductase, E3
MSFRVRLSPSGEAFGVREGESVLAAAARAGVGLPCDCRLGGCGTCRVKVLEGRVVYDEPPMALSPEEEAEGYALACQARAASDLVIRVASAALAAPARYAATITGIDTFSPEVFHLRLETDMPVDFLPGQYMKVHLASRATRNFSMASRPAGCALDFHVRRIPGGHFTDGLLKNMRAGDRLEVEAPHGAFFYRESDAMPIVMAATGTGLAPLRSILESLLATPGRPPVKLYWGGRTSADLYLRKELAAWAARFADFRFVPVLSRPEPGWQGRRGYVQQAACEDLDDLSGHAVYLCGSPTMVADARRTFCARGADVDHIYSDSFVFQREEELT